MAIAKKTVAKSATKTVAKKQTVAKVEPAQNSIELDVENDEDKDVVIDELIPPVKHSYDNKIGCFTAEKDNGEKLEMFIPEILPSDYCMLVRKFMCLNNAVSIGKYSVGTHACVDYGELENAQDEIYYGEHCYNIVSECGVEFLEKALAKLKSGGRCFVVDSNINLEEIAYKLKGMHVRFVGYGYKLFNHRYWHNHKNMSILLLIKG